MNYSLNKYGSDFKFDFDIGYLIKSPCKDCIQRDGFPECADECEILDKIHAMMTECISSSRRT
ncbi:hypothetical protein QUF90_04570 [Desulfococcaceae bacterium HSG9]|nr:hypothetical protein [Desulfococcaceae bacterium HSG9]